MPPREKTALEKLTSQKICVDIDLRAQCIALAIVGMTCNVFWILIEIGWNHYNAGVKSIMPFAIIVSDIGLFINVCLLFGSVWKVAAITILYLTVSMIHMILQLGLIAYFLFLHPAQPDTVGQENDGENDKIPFIFAMVKCILVFIHIYIWFSALRYTRQLNTEEYKNIDEPD